MKRFLRRFLRRFSLFVPDNVQDNRAATDIVFKRRAASGSVCITVFALFLLRYRCPLLDGTRRIRNIRKSVQSQKSKPLLEAEL